ELAVNVHAGIIRGLGGMAHCQHLWMATSVRIEWEEIPLSVRARVEELLGARVVRAVNESGGYGNGLAARCRLSDGRRAFVKAATSPINEVLPRMLRREVRISAQLPPEFPAPTLLGCVETDGWIAA